MASASAHVSRQRLKRGGAGGDRANFAPQYFPSRAPLVPYWRDYNSHGEGSVGKDLKRLCSFCSSASLGDRVARIVGSLFLFAKSVGDGAHEPRGPQGWSMLPLPFAAGILEANLVSNEGSSGAAEAGYLYAVWRERPHQCPLQTHVQ
jgi:hypothetical protein